MNAPRSATLFRKDCAPTILTFRRRRQQSLQRLGAAADARRRARIVADHVQPLAGGGRIIGAPCRQREKFTRGMPIGAVLAAGRLEALTHGGVRLRLHEQSACANPREVLFRTGNRGIGRNGVVELPGSLRIALGGLRSGTQPRQPAVALGAVCGDPGKGSLGFGAPALIGQGNRGLESRSGLGGLLRLEILIAAPAADGGDDQNRPGNNEDRITLPKLLELLAAQIIVYFIKYFRPLTVPPGLFWKDL